MPAHALEGYASEVSVAPGDVLHLHVSGVSGLRYQVRIFRIGWYRGMGARRLLCRACRPRVASAQALPAADPATGLLRLSWPVTERIRIGGDWVSGYYLAELVVPAERWQDAARWVPFVVRAPASRRSAILVQAAVNTWQAYNRWGGAQPLLEPHRRRRRPCLFRPPVRLQARRRGGPAEPSAAWEFPLARFLERYGYDVAYTTDVDTDRRPDRAAAPPAGDDSRARRVLDEGDAGRLRSRSRARA